MQIYRRDPKAANYSMRKRVPRRYRDVEARSDLIVALHTDSLSMARMKADAIWQEMIEGWEARLAMRGQDAAKRFAAAHEIAQRRGYAYVPADEMPSLPDEEIVARIEAVGGGDDTPEWKRRTHCWEPWSVPA